MKANVPPPAEADVVLRVRGTVQGVGFRPFVRIAASSLRLRGWVRNDTQGVLIRAKGSRQAVEALALLIESGAPKAARVEAVERLSPGNETAPVEDSFIIVQSESARRTIETAIPSDLALCDACRAEMNDPSNRRFGYPFINCTQCGPRYSIIESVPYDRPRTTMRRFGMCPDCKAEYVNPDDRRFHAQPNACPVCGPKVWLRNPAGEIDLSEAVFSKAGNLLADGAILAVQGIGGYHLMVDATNDGAVRELRRRKGRDEKPFAVMFPSLADARTVLAITPEAEALLTSSAAPIVLVASRSLSPISSSVAPGNPWIGALLPYSPLHLRLLSAFGRPVIATSANFSDEPLCFTHAEADERLLAIADAFLEHNRPIAHPIDDSIIRLSDSGAITMRRARGLAPSPLCLPALVAGSLLCVGAQMKNTIGVASGRQLVLSPHIGDLGGLATREVFQRTADTLVGLLESPISTVVCDKHPDYTSTQFANHYGKPVIAVQHHLAHILAVLLENRQAPHGVLGVSWDGTGYGEDGTIWGGEFILLENGRASRFGRLRPFSLPGGEAAIKDARRTALALVHGTRGAELAAIGASLGLASEAATLIQMIERRLNSPTATSAGRLFDGFGALLGLGNVNRYEGQIPLAVEICARSWAHEGASLPLDISTLGEGLGARFELDWRPLVEALIRSRRTGIPVAALARGFHDALANGIVAMARKSGVDTVALSGGCFQNALLLDCVNRSLRGAGFRVLLHKELPPNDGNIAAGQALGALWNLTTVDLP